MMDIAVSLTIGICIGAFGLVGCLWGVDEYRSWRYRWTRARKLRARPPVPGNIARFEILDIGEHGDHIWYVEAKDTDGQRIETDSGEHPMDAIANLVTQMKDEAA